MDVLQAPNVSLQKKMELTDGHTFEDGNDEAIFIMEIRCLAIQLPVQPAGRYPADRGQFQCYSSSGSILRCDTEVPLQNSIHHMQPI